MAVYKLIWDDFCSWYLEMVKPEYQAPIDRETKEKTIVLFENLMKVLHPFMPFITEELWQQLAKRKDGEAIMLTDWPQSGSFDTKTIDEASKIFEIVSQIRNVRASKGISPKEAFELTIHTKDQALYTKYEAIISKLANINSISFGDNVENAVSFVVKSDEFFIPLNEKIDLEQERENLQKELDYTLGFLKAVSKKLENEKFVNSAPEAVVAREKKKMEDAMSKVKALEDNIKKLG